jgi:hypothetical protein
MKKQLNNRGGKSWTEYDLRILTAMSEDFKLIEIAKRLGRSTREVRERADALKLHSASDNEKGRPLAETPLPLPNTQRKDQTTPNASIASATFLKPAMFAPFT